MANIGKRKGGTIYVPRRTGKRRVYPVPRIKPLRKPAPKREPAKEPAKEPAETPA